MVATSFSLAQIAGSPGLQRNGAPITPEPRRDDPPCRPRKTYGFGSWGLAVGFTAIQLAFFKSGSVQNFVQRKGYSLPFGFGPKLFTQLSSRLIIANLLLSVGVEWYRQSLIQGEPLNLDWDKMSLDRATEYNPLPTIAFAFATGIHAGIVKTVNQSPRFQSWIKTPGGLRPGRVLNPRGVLNCLKLDMITCITGPAILAFYGAAIAYERHHEGRDPYVSIAEGAVLVLQTTIVSILLTGWMRRAPGLHYFDPVKDWGYIAVNHGLLWIQQNLGVSWLNQRLAAQTKSILGFPPEKKVPVC